MLAALGDETQVRWLWSDLCSPVSAHRIAAHRALRNRGYKPYYDVLIRRAQIEPFPRPELRNLMRRLEGAPPLGAGNRPEQDQQIAKIRAWWKAHRDQLVWDVRKRRFQLPSD